MRKSALLLSLPLLGLSACSALHPFGFVEDAQVPLQSAEPAVSGRPEYFVSPAMYDGEAYQATRQSHLKQSPLYMPQQQVSVNHYVQGMMHDLVANLDQVTPQMTIGITSFVYLDGAYDQSDLLGNQLAESFMHEVHQFGLEVVDFKTTDYIRVTPAGDYVFSRDFMELKADQPIEYVLAGTLVRHQGGTLVNARLVSVSSKKVTASAQGFIPQNIVDALYQSGGAEQLQLRQGE